MTNHEDRYVYITHCILFLVFGEELVILCIDTWLFYCHFVAAVLCFLVTHEIFHRGKNT